MPLRPPLPLLALLALSPLAVPAEDTPPLHLSGFGSLAATRTDDPAIGFKRNFQKRANADEWSLEADSRLGVQLDLQLNPSWQGVVQVVGMQRERGKFHPTVEWANLAWEINPNWRLRLGRMVTPVTSTSESREIGYAQLGARAPLETVGIYPMVGHDGADLRYRQSLGSGEARLQVFAGRTAFKLPFLEYEVDQVTGALFTYTVNDWTLRYAHTRIRDARATGGSYLETTRPLVAGLNGIASFCANTLCSDTIMRINRLSSGWGGYFNVLSLGYEDGSWSLQTEYATRKVDTFISDGRSLVALLGYHHGELTPYLGFSRADSTNRQRAVQFAVSNPALQPTATMLAGIVSRNLYEPQAANRKLYTLGLRWDVHEQLALKFQLDQIRHKYTDANYNGFYVRQPDANGQLRPYDGRLRLYSLSADFVF